MLQVLMSYFWTHKPLYAKEKETEQQEASGRQLYRSGHRDLTQQ